MRKLKHREVTELWADTQPVNDETGLSIKQKPRSWAWTLNHYALLPSGCSASVNTAWGWNRSLIRKQSCSQRKEGPAWKMWPWNIVMEIDESVMGHKLRLSLLQAVWLCLLLCHWTCVCLCALSGALGLWGTRVRGGRCLDQHSVYLWRFLSRICHMRAYACDTLAGKLWVLFNQKHPSCWCFFPDSKVIPVHIKKEIQTAPKI